MKRWIDLEENEQSYNLLLDYARNGMLEIYEISKQFIPKEYMTKEFFEILVNKNSGYITVTPTEFITNEMATMVVTENGSLIQYIPLEKRTQKICDIAFAYSKKILNIFRKI